MTPWAGSRLKGLGTWNCFQVEILGHLLACPDRKGILECCWVPGKDSKLRECQLAPERRR